MKGFQVVNLSIGNIGIKFFLQGSSLIGDKTGASTHSHAFFEYHFIMNGDAVMKFDNDKVIIPKCSSVLIFPDTFHNFSEGDVKANIFSLSFSVKKNRYGVDYYKSIESKLIDKKFLITKETTALKELILSIVSTVYSKNLFAHEEIRSRLTLLFITIFSNLSDEKKITTGFYPHPNMTREHI